MTGRLIQFALRNRALVRVAAALLLVLGTHTALRMQVDVFPDLTAPTVAVITEVHGMAPLEVESQVTLPLESAVNGAPGVRRGRSSTAVGASIIWAEFDWGMDPYRARQIVGERIQTVVSTLPPEVEPPVLMPQTSIVGEVMFLALTSERQTPTEMHTWADTVLKTAKARYAAGDISLTEMLPARRDWAAVQLSYLESLRDVMQAWAALSPYVGKP